MIIKISKEFVDNYVELYNQKHTQLFVLTIFIFKYTKV